MTRLREKITKVWNRQPMLFTAFVIIGILFYTTGLVHEFGHYLAGVNSGSTCEVYWWLETHCVPAPQPSWLYFSLGGIFGTITTSLLFISKKVRKNKGIFIGVSVITLDHFLKAIFETRNHFAYLNNFVFVMLMGSLPILLMFALWIIFTKQANNKPNSSHHQPP